MSAAGFSSIAALTWGGSDFVGGFGTRRAPAQLVVISGHLVSFALLLSYCTLARVPMHDHGGMVWAAIGGFVGSLSLALFYRALAMGAMGLTAALTGLATALIPVLFSLLHEGLPGKMVLAGIAVGLVAIWMISSQPGQKTPKKALLLGVVAGCGFGVQLTVFKLAAVSGVLWTMTLSRAAGCLAMLLVIALAPPAKGLWRGFWLAGVGAGLLDTAGNLFYIRASVEGRLDVAAMVSSLYPAITILLAALVLKERPTRRQLAGMALALAAVGLLSR